MEGLGWGLKERGYNEIVFVLLETGGNGMGEERKVPYLCLISFMRLDEPAALGCLSWRVSTKGDYKDEVRNCIVQRRRPRAE